MKLLICLVLVQVGVALDYQKGGRVAPGVPPQRYNPQQGQIPPQHHIPVQHVPQQQHHVPGVPPVQHQQQHVPQQVPAQQQVPNQQGHATKYGHGYGHEQSKLLDASNVVNERSHIQEHMDLPIDTSQMTEQELQFHYFKMHDADNNNKLDGCELVKSLMHSHGGADHHNTNSAQAIPEPKIFNDEELIQIIDPILLRDDLNKDGSIDYAEFSRSQANANAAIRGASPGHQ